MQAHASATAIGAVQANGATEPANVQLGVHGTLRAGGSAATGSTAPSGATQGTAAGHATASLASSGPSPAHAMAHAAVGPTKVSANLLSGAPASLGTHGGTIGAISLVAASSSNASAALSTGAGPAGAAGSAAAHVTASVALPVSVAAKALAVAGVAVAGLAVAASVGLGPAAGLHATLSGIPPWIHAPSLLTSLQTHLQLGGGGSLTLP